MKTEKELWNDVGVVQRRKEKAASNLLYSLGILASSLDEHAFWELANVGIVVRNAHKMVDAEHTLGLLTLHLNTRKKVGRKAKEG